MTQQLQWATASPPDIPAASTLTVGVVGLGYVGLPTAIGFADGGTRVVGVDVSSARRDAITSGQVDLASHEIHRLRQALRNRLITVSDDAGMLAAVDAIVICVPTPVDEHLTPDLGPLRTACDQVVAVARTGQLIVLTSTSYVGTTEELLIGPLAARGFLIGTDIHVAFSPERIDPGNASITHECVPRVVGGATAECARRAADLLGRVTRQVHVVSSTRAAEMTKLYENTFRAVNIALVNEIADASGELAVPITEVIDAAATKPYGFMPFAPGPGVGGHCIPCDPHYLLWQLRSKRVSMPLVQSAMNDIAERPARIVARVREELAERDIPLRNSRIVMVGVAYKPGVADVRESPALEIMKRLIDLGVQVRYVDPFVPRVWVAGSLLEASTAVDMRADPPADLAVLHTRHPGVEMSWLDSIPVVLDATYRAFDLRHRVSV